MHVQVITGQQPLQVCKVVGLTEIAYFREQKGARYEDRQGLGHTMWSFGIDTGSGIAGKPNFACHHSQH